jgi:hypothetical protein
VSASWQSVSAFFAISVPLKSALDAAAGLLSYDNPAYIIDIALTQSIL